MEGFALEMRVQGEVIETAVCEAVSVVWWVLVFYASNFFVLGVLWRKG